MIDQHDALKLELIEVLAYLNHVDFEFQFDDQASYPYPKNYPGNLPYRPTIEAIENSLRLLDKVERLTNPNAKPLYHFDKYLYHKQSLLADHDVIVFPIVESLTEEDLILMRSVPIGFVGVQFTTVLVDRHYQTPLDYWYHDMNHVRRMWGYLQLKLRLLGAKTKRAKFEVYRSMDRFVTNIILPQILPAKKSESIEEMAIRKLIKMIVFEIFHESALNADAESLIADMLRSGDVKQPFEHMIQSQKVGEDFENKYRTSSGNVASGSHHFSERDGTSPIGLRFFMDRSLGLLATVYNKLTHGFYDDVNSPNSELVPIEFRTPENVAKAAYEIFRFLGHGTTTNLEVLTQLASSAKGGAEKFTYQGLAKDPRIEAQKNAILAELKKEPYISELLTPQQAKVALNQEYNQRGLKIRAIFGFSKLDYQDEGAFQAAVLEIAKKYDPAKDAILIGATVNGIGRAYEVFEKMGFQTLGVVSELALVHSGKFSKSVQRVYVLKDKTWGGRDEATGKLTPTSEVFVESSDSVDAIGGNAHTALVMQEMKSRNKPVSYSSVEMNHKIAIEDANLWGRNSPTDFKGDAYYKWEELNSDPSAGKSCIDRLR